jgi:hypothetical protein
MAPSDSQSIGTGQALALDPARAARSRWTMCKTLLRKRKQGRLTP